MRFCLLASASVIVALSCSVMTGAPAQTAPLQPVRDAYEPADIAPAPNTPVIFVDALNQSSPWLSAGPLTLDGDGQVVALASGQSAQRVVYAAGQAHPAGYYTLLFDGRGMFEIRGGAIVAQTQGRYVVAVTSGSEELDLRLVSIDQIDPARKIRLILPGFENTYVAHPFYPRYLASLAGVQTLRFATWSQVATLSKSMVWPLRPRVSRVTQAMEAGVAPEFEIALANATGADPWFALPVGATDAYVYGIADLAHRLLDRRLRPVFEYGDRVWRDGTPSNAYARMAARNDGLPLDPRTGALEWYALRSTQVFSVIDRAFGRDAALVDHMLCIPGGDDALDAAAARTILTYAGAARHADVLTVDAQGDAAFAEDLAISRAAGGPNASWRQAGVDRWIGIGLPDRAPILPDVRLVFVAGQDLTPPPERHGRPPVALHIFPLVSSKIGAPHIGDTPGLAVALGEPLQDVDLSHDGVSDWMYAPALGASESKMMGGRQISVQPISGRAGTATGGIARFAWSDGAPHVRGVGGQGIFVWGTGNGFRITAPADATARMLRLYVAVSDARGMMTVHLDGRAYQDASLASLRATRDGVYTLVYRARGPERIDVAFTAAATFAAAGGVALRAATLAPAANVPAAPSADEAMYHNDRLRTGWNPNESTLNSTNVSPSTFGLLQTLTVDGDVLAQPLYLSQYSLPSGTRNVLIVATEHDSIYEFDADTGSLIVHAHLGRSQSSSDVGCADINPEYGITSTPVIDRAKGRIYVVSAVEPAPFSFHTKLHALDIGTLRDVVKPVEIAASVMLSNGSTITFDPQNQMNRASIAMANHSIYLGIGSHCDNNAGNIVGWVLRYDASLKQIGAFATTEDSDTYLLSSVWMTGFAPAIDPRGNLFVVTGNGSFDAENGGKNYGESVLRLPLDLSAPSDYFTPQDWSNLNGGDTDFGSGGVMLLPTQQGSVKQVAVAQGKASKIFLLDRHNLGKEQSNDAGALQTIPNTGGGVWGGPAYYNGPTGQFVYYQAGGAPLLAFSVMQNSNGVPQLQLASSGPSYAGYGGSTPVVSSNGQMPGTGIVWLVNRSTPLVLEAYDATDVSRLLFSGAAGQWANPQNNGFVTPLVANGKVYVPATGTISVFGLGGSSIASIAGGRAGLAPGEHRITGKIVRVSGNWLTLRVRDGREVQVDVTPARAARHLGVLPIGRAVTAYGSIDRTGTFRVTSIGHTDSNAADWPSDR
jgi:hypothetical protein